MIDDIFELIILDKEYRILLQLDFGEYFVIKFKVDKAFHYEGLEKAIYEAVSSNGINIILIIISIISVISISFMKINN